MFLSKHPGKRPEQAVRAVETAVRKIRPVIRPNQTKRAFVPRAIGTAGGATNASLFKRAVVGFALDMSPQGHVKKLGGHRLPSPLRC